QSRISIPRRVLLGDVAVIDEDDQFTAVPVDAAEIVEQCPLIVLLLAVLIPGFPGPNAGSGDASKPLADRRESLSLSLRDDERLRTQHRFGGQALGDVEMVAAALGGQVLGRLVVARTLPGSVETYPNKLRMSRVWEHDAAAPYVPPQQLLDVVSCGRPEALALDDLLQDARPIPELEEMVYGYCASALQCRDVHHRQGLLPSKSRDVGRPDQNGAASSSVSEALPGTA